MAGMNSTLNTPLVWVDEEETLKKFTQTVNGSRQVAVDTESNSLFAYQEQVCLIQVTAENRDYLIDGLAELDLSGLGRIFADGSVEKIFHAAEYDIICLKRDFGFTFTNLFDTMQAARILGYEKLGLANLLNDLFGIDQGKSFQKGNWGKRPLPEGMLEYARMDTHFLSKLRDHLEKQLIQKDLLDLAKEDFQRLCKVENNHKDSPLYAQVSGYHHLEPQELRILEELCQYRDTEAQKRNRPHFKIIGNSALMAVTQSNPSSLAELMRVEGVSPKLIDRYATGILTAVKQGNELPPIHLKHRRRPSQSYIDRLEALKDWRKKAAREMGVQSDIILPRDILEDIAGKKPADRVVLEAIMEEVPWRYAHFSGQIMDVIEQEK